MTLLKRQIVRLAFEECGVSAYHNGVPFADFAETGVSPSKHKIIRLALQECGIPAFYDGILPADYQGGADSPTKREIIRLALQECGIPAFDAAITPSEYKGGADGPTKQRIIELALQECGIPAFYAAITPSEYKGGDDSPTKQQIVDLAFQECGIVRGVPDVDPSPTKQQIIELAFEECGQSTFNDGVTPEEFASADRRLDAMMAEWNTSFGFGLEYDKAADLNAVSGVPASAFQVVALGLALRLAPTIGKTLGDDTHAQFTLAFDRLRASTDDYAYDRLDAMLSDWLTYEINIGYDPDAGSDDPSGIPLSALQVVAVGLATRLAPTLGKPLSEETKAVWANDFANLRTFFNIGATDRLDAMMAEWLTYEVDIGYDESATLTDPSGIPSSALQVVSMGLAIRIASVLGKDLTASAKETWLSDFANLRTFFNIGALDRLDAMLDEWLTYQIDLGYQKARGIDELSGIPATALQVVSVGLALRIGPVIDKTFTDATKEAWAADYDNLRAFFVSSALPRLDAMMAEWKAAYQIDLGYSYSASYDAVSGVPASVLQVAATALALRIAQAIGRKIGDDVKALHAATFDALRIYYNTSPYSRLDSMMREWCGAYGINVGYIFPDSGETSTAEEDSGVNPSAEQVVITSLAMRIAPAIGKSLSTEARAAHAASFANLRSSYTSIPTMRFNSQTPRGAGNRGWRRYYSGFDSCDRRQLTSGGVPIVDDP